jgi:hypothetical protein
MFKRASKKSENAYIWTEGVSFYVVGRAAEQKHEEGCVLVYDRAPKPAGRDEGTQDDKLQRNKATGVLYYLNPSGAEHVAEAAFRLFTSVRLLLRRAEISELGAKQCATTAHVAPSGHGRIHAASSPSHPALNEAKGDDDACNKSRLLPFPTRAARSFVRRTRSTAVAVHALAACLCPIWHRSPLSQLEIRRVPNCRCREPFLFYCTLPCVRAEVEFRTFSYPREDR